MLKWNHGETPIVQMEWSTKLIMIIMGFNIRDVYTEIKLYLGQQGKGINKAYINRGFIVIRHH